MSALKAFAFKALCFCVVFILCYNRPLVYLIVVGALHEAPKHGRILCKNGQLQGLSLRACRTQRRCTTRRGGFPRPPEKRQDTVAVVSFSLFFPLSFHTFSKNRTAQKQ